MRVADGKGKALECTLRLPYSSAFLYDELVLLSSSLSISRSLSLSLFLLRVQEEGVGD